jgi:hypothetical protein
MVRVTVSRSCNPPATASARSSRSRSVSGSQVTNAGSAQYVSKVASNLAVSSGVCEPASLTFHSDRRAGRPG